MDGIKVWKMSYPHSVFLFINSLTLRTNESRVTKNAGPEKIIKTHGEPSSNTAASDAG